MRSTVLCLAWFLLALPLQAQQHIAPTDAQTPEQERQKFKLPEGFEIQLIISEPDIGQPMNLNFDARGRLWITHSIEYPFPAKGEGVQPRDQRFAGGGDNPPRDRLTVIDKLLPNGRAASVRNFAEGLNIPIGQTPIGDGSTALVYSIPAIFRCIDTDGDGKSDKREELYGRFGNVDTHGMSNSYTPWVDGWIYGCHGFSNTSRITDGSGHVTEMTSGNTYRFKADGSRFEQYTYGQVNPFGMTFDPLGNLYDADCHSLPVYMLLRGGDYPHFGKKAGPLGFGPTMINHNHGSTGICGVAYYTGEQFPADYQDNLFICNPVTGRVHRDKLKQFGSTYQVDSQPDFIQCSDPWFRPVDAYMGPDGALYIADFYNAIIGHYEVPLPHPKRDRNHGRVWRVVYRGKDNRQPTPVTDLTKLDTDQLVAQLANPNLLIRTQATNWLVDGHPKGAPDAVRRALKKTDVSAEQRAHGLWVIERLDGLDDAELTRFAKDPDRLVRVHLIKALGERAKWTPAQFELARKALADDDAFVRRAAADALERHPDAANVAPLLACWGSALPQDTHLIYMVKLALRSHFDSEAAVQGLLAQEFPAADVKRLLAIASASTGDAAAAFLLRHAKPGELDADILERAVPQIARNGTQQQVDQLIALVRGSFPQDAARQFSLFRLVVQGLGQRGQRPEQQASVGKWFGELVPPLLAQLADASAVWTNQPLPDRPNSPSPWGVRQRKCTDGRTINVIDSISHGEQLTGVYRSRPFTLPPQLSFWMCGHNGQPNTNPPPDNRIRLKLVESGQVVARQVPPRNDTARKYTWDLKDHAGQRGVIEIVDANTAGAYAWLAVGDFSPPVVRVPGGEAGDDSTELLAMIGRFRLQDHLPQLLALAADADQPGEIRAAAAVSADRLGAREKILPLLGGLLSRPQSGNAARMQAADALGAINSDEARKILSESLSQVPAALQRSIALSLCNTPAGATALFEALKKGKASARLLQDQEVDQRFKQRAPQELQTQAAELLKGLPSVEQRLLKLMADRRATYNPEQTDAGRGKAVFTKNCAICHKVGDEGKTIGPQLDGVGLRGIDRLLEDMLDPNRNVDAAFRTMTIVTTEGKVLTGLRRRQEGKLLVIADQQGKEIEISTDDIDESQPSNLSLMPANLVETLKPADLHDLLTYLLTLQTKKAE